jgi:ElaB/YqjD/DUF883 family membrane-anchored ribosome-binding protein
MKRILTIGAVMFLLTACDQSTAAATKTKIDSLGDKVESGVNKAWDSAKAGAKEIREKVGNKLDELKDSANRKRDTTLKK